MKITFSSTTVLRKLKEYGCKYDEDVLIEKAAVSKHLVKILSLKEKARNVELLETAKCDLSSKTTTTTTTNQQTSGDQQLPLLRMALAYHQKILKA